MDLYVLSSDCTFFGKVNYLRKIDNQIYGIILNFNYQRKVLLAEFVDDLHCEKIMQSIIANITSLNTSYIFIDFCNSI